MDKNWGGYAFHVTILKICAKALMSKYVFRQSTGNKN